MADQTVEGLVSENQEVEKKLYRIQRQVIHCIKRQR